MNKRGIELGLNFLVLLIISIVVFTLGVQFIYKMFENSAKVREEVEEWSNRELEEINCPSSEKVCVGSIKKMAKRGEIAVFSIKILNILDSQKFIIKSEASSPPGFTLEKAPITNSLHFLNPSIQIQLGRNEEQKRAIGVEIPKNAVSGQYIINVLIIAENGERYGDINKLYVEVS